MMMIAINSHDSASVAPAYVVCDPVGGDTLPAQPSQRANVPLVRIQKSVNCNLHRVQNCRIRHFVAVVGELVLPGLPGRQFGVVLVVATSPEQY